MNNFIIVELILQHLLCTDPCLQERKARFLAFWLSGRFVGLQPKGHKFNSNNLSKYYVGIKSVYILSVLTCPQQEPCAQVLFTLSFTIPHMHVHHGYLYI
ncbi:hypothetical protein HS088_TW22G00810 [Tripterygium wilfordii]|uniref:Uncharacterized protein n=1 Tax=Tripterygium wilfordii TaxID=458696 RepID=A0A7J7BZ20_TRIWF|nr:hypothetical protein HS088_TW22G00810 [Tripterygium wilfordii]